MRPSAPRSPWLLAALLALPAYLEPVVRLGAVHPDEIFQAIEPAFTQVYGRGYVPWEWKVGLRNEAVVGLLAALYRAARAVGLADPQAVRALLHAPLYLLAVALLVAVHGIVARRLPEDRAPRLAKFGMAVVALSPVFVFFQTRNLSESWSAAFLVLAFAALDPTRGAAPHAPRIDSPEILQKESGFSVARAFFLGGVAFGLATVTRYPSLVLVGPGALAAILATGGSLRERVRNNLWKIVPLALGFLLPIGAVGLLDAVTWGRRIPGLWAGGAFHSWISYVDFNFIRGVAARWFGTRPFYFYLPRLYLVAPLFGVWGLLQRRASGDATPRRYDAPLLAAAFYTAVLFAMPHKESRFLYPALLLATVAILPDTLLFVARLPATFAAGNLLAKLGVVGGIVFAVVPYFVPGPFAPAHQDGFRAELAASRAASGLVVVGIPFEALGGFSMLGVDKPLCVAADADDPCIEKMLADGAVRRAFVTDAQRSRVEATLRAHSFVEGDRDGRGGTWTR